MRFYRLSRGCERVNWQKHVAAPGAMENCLLVGIDARSRIEIFLWESVSIDSRM